MNGFADDTALRPDAIRAEPPTSWAGWVKQEQLTEEPEDVRHLMFRAWLSQNEPSPELVRSVQSRGLGHLLES